MIHHGGAEDTEGKCEKLKLCVLRASGVNPAFCFLTPALRGWVLCSQLFFARV
jgi:hypothetical protein